MRIASPQGYYPAGGKLYTDFPHSPTLSTGVLLQPGGWVNTAVRYLLAIEAVLLALLAWSLARPGASLAAWLVLAGVLLVQAAALVYWRPSPGQRRRPRRTTLTDMV